MAKILDRSRKVSSKQRPQRKRLDGSSYLSRGIEKNAKNSIERLISRRCRAGIETSIEAGIESPEEEILSRRNNTSPKHCTHFDSHRSWMTVDKYVLHMVDHG